MTDNAKPANERLADVILGTMAGLFWGAFIAGFILLLTGAWL